MSVVLADRAVAKNLSEIEKKLEWLANLTNAKAKRAYKRDVAKFLAFV